MCAFVLFVRSFARLFDRSMDRTVIGKRVHVYGVPMHVYVHTFQDNYSCDIFVYGIILMAIPHYHAIRMKCVKLNAIDCLSE